MPPVTFYTPENIGKNWLRDILHVLYLSIFKL